MLQTCWRSTCSHVVYALLRWHCACTDLQSCSLQVVQCFQNLPPLLLCCKSYVAFFAVGCLLDKSARTIATFQAAPSRKWRNNAPFLGHVYACLEAHHYCMTCRNPRAEVSSTIFLESLKIRDVMWTTLSKMKCNRMADGLK